jgi:hypothetical protein
MTRYRSRLGRVLFVVLLSFLAVARAPAGQEFDFIPQPVNVPAGAFLAGSDRLERELACSVDEAAMGTKRHAWANGMSANVLFSRVERLPSLSRESRLRTPNTPHLLAQSATGRWMYSSICGTRMV